MLQKVINYRRERVGRAVAASRQATTQSTNSAFPAQPTINHPRFSYLECNLGVAKPHIYDHI